MKVVFHAEMVPRMAQRCSMLQHVAACCSMITQIHTVISRSFEFRTPCDVCVLPGVCVGDAAAPRQHHSVDRRRVFRGGSWWLELAIQNHTKPYKTYNMSQHVTTCHNNFGNLCHNIDLCKASFHAFSCLFFHLRSVFSSLVVCRTSDPS